MLKKILSSTLFVLCLSLPLMAKDRQNAEAEDFSKEEINQRRSSRGLVQLENTIVEKGQLILGATASYSQHTNDNYTLAIIEGINSSGYTVRASPLVAYAVGDNLLVGARFNYARSYLKIDDAQFSYGGDPADGGTEIVLNDFYAIDQQFTAMAIARQYIPLGRLKRISFFTEMQLEAGWRRAKTAREVPVEGVFAKGYNFGLNVVPGISAFATENVAFEVTVGMLGIGYSNTQQTENQVYLGEFESTNVNFKVNLLAIGLGVAFYL